MESKTANMLISNILDRAHSYEKIPYWDRGPESIYWDITYRCNLHCKHCLNNAGDRFSHDYDQELSLDEASKLIRQIAEIRPHNLCICGGEPLLRYDLVKQILRGMKQAGIPTNMVSNGWLVTDKVAKELKKSDIQSVQISLDGLGYEHDLFREQSGAFDRAVEAIRILTDNGIMVVVSFCPNRYNFHNFEAYAGFVDSLQCPMIRMMPLTPLGRGRQNYDELKLTSEETYLFVQNIHRLRKKHPKMDFIWGDPLDHMTRILLNRRTTPLTVGIFANGDISITAYLNYIVGNIKNHTLSEYWKSGLRHGLAHPRILDGLRNARNLNSLTLQNAPCYVDVKSQ